MAKVKIPEPEYINDGVTGAIYETPNGALLMINAPNAPLEQDVPPGANVIARGAFTIRYAISLITPAYEAIIPGLFFGERGGALVGREGWQYLQDHFQVHPRADIVGLKPDGSAGQYLVRELDFGVPVRVFAYATPSDTKPLAELRAFSAPDGTSDGTPHIPELLIRYLPRRPFTG